MQNNPKEKTLIFELVLPCYNESKSLQVIIERTITAANKHHLDPKDFQLILVENGSRDESLKIMQELKKNPKLGPWFKIIEVKKNEGYGFGLWQGLQTTSAQWVGWSHADQQCDPEDAFKALKILKKMQKDQPNLKILIKGKRFGRNWKDRFVSFIFKLFAKVILNLKTSEINAQPKVFDKDLLLNCVSPPKDFSFDLYVLYQAQKAGYKFHEIAVYFPPRIHGLSNWAYSFKSRWKTIQNMIKFMLQLRKTEGRLS